MPACRSTARASATTSTGMAFDAVLDGHPASVARVTVDDGAGHQAVALVGETLLKRERTRDNIVLLLAPVARCWPAPPR